MSINKYTKNLLSNLTIFFLVILSILASGININEIPINNTINKAITLVYELVNFNGNDISYNMEIITTITISDVIPIATVKNSLFTFKSIL